MATLIKLTAPLAARVGDYLLLNKSGVQVVNGPEFEKLVNQKLEQTPNHAPRKHRPKKELDADCKLILRFIKELPGIRSGDLGELLLAEGSTMKKGNISKRLELLAKAGRIKRHPIGGSPKHTLWEYHPIHTDYEEK